MSYEKEAVEFLKCKKSIFYFIYNYCFLQQVGGKVKITPGNLHYKAVQSIKLLLNVHKCIFMASRQLGKSSVAAMVLTWVANFFPGVQILIVNMSKSAAYENLNKIKFVHKHIPAFLASPMKYSGDRKSYIEFENGSIIKTFFYSTTQSPDTVGRSLTAPVLYIDECGFIPKMHDIYTAAQPVLSKAREQAVANGYPYFMFLTSTPNGTMGTGEWFHQMWTNAMDSDQLFDPTNSLVDDFIAQMANPVHNSFAKVRYHWSEIYTQSWYQEQCRELNFNTRKINQELDLMFVGGATSIFDDDFLSSLKPRSPIKTVPLSSTGSLKIFVDEIDPGDFYIISADTAKSITGDFCSLEVVKFSTFEQVAEYNEKIGSTGKYATDIKQIINWLRELVGDNIILAIENNSMGCAVLERLDEDEDENYTKYFCNSKDDGNHGINTNTKTKPMMISFLFDLLLPAPEIIHSHAIIDQLSVIERKANGSVAAQSGFHDDLFMSLALAAYARKMMEFEIAPKLNPATAKAMEKDTSNVIHQIGSTALDTTNSMDQIREIEQHRKLIQSSSDYDENDESMSRIITDLF